MSSDRPALDEAVRLVLEHALDAAPTLGESRLVCVDGPAGSGKTTLADALLAAGGRQVPSVSLLHMDDLYEGWQGLGDVGARVRDDIVVPLSHGEPGHYRRWDWSAGAWAEEHLVDPVSLLLIEGVGAGAGQYADAITTLVWVEAPGDLRLARGVERDGEGMRARWEAWQVSEEDLFERQATRSRADVIVDGTGATPPRLG